MNRHFRSFYCRRCEHIRQFTKRGIHHRRHLYATIFTFGVWGAVWLYLHHHEQRRTWRCTICRGRQRTTQSSARKSKTEALVGALSIEPRR